jgi:WD40 repeat protein
MARVFVSYSSKDRTVAETVHGYLEGEHFDVWRDQRSIETNWSREIAYGLASCDALALVWSDNSACSAWVQHEWVTARAIEKPIVPILLPNAPRLPAVLTNLQAINELQSNRSERLAERLAKALEARVSYEYQMLPGNSQIPFLPNPTFAGRHADLIELYLKFIGNLNKIGTSHVGLTGMGGIGKTQLAIEFAYRFSFAFQHVFWIQASEPWLPQFVGIAKRIGSIVGKSTAQEDSQELLVALKTYCLTHPSTLIVMDNVREPLALNDPHELGGSEISVLTISADILFTTRKNFDFPELGVSSQPVGELSADAAYELLTRDRKPSDAFEQEQARAIVNALGYLPLAVVLAAGMLRKRKWIGFANYRETLANNLLETIDMKVISAVELATRHSAAVAATLHEQWTLLTDDYARCIFSLAAFFDESEIVPNRRLELLAGTKESRSILDSPFDQALTELRDLNLVEEVQNGLALRLHPLIRDFSLKLSAGSAAAIKWQAVSRVQTIYDQVLLLEAEHSARGIDEVIGDLDVTLRWCTPDAPFFQKLRMLYRILDRERRALNSGTPGLSFFQQLYCRAKNMGLSSLADRFRSAVRRNPGLFFQLSQTTEVEDPAVVRTLFMGPRSAGVKEAVSISALRVTPDGTKALIGASDGKLTLWEINTGRLLRNFKGEWPNVHAVSFGDNWVRAMVKSELAVTVWDVESQQPLVTFSHEGLVLMFDWTPEVIRQGHWDHIAFATLSGDGRRAATGSRDGTLILWDVDSRKGLGQWYIPGIESGGLQLSWSGDHFLQSSFGGGLIIWDVQTNERTRAAQAGRDAMSALSLSGDHRRAFGRADAFSRELFLIDLEHRKMLRKTRPVSGSARCTSLSHNGRIGLTGSHDGLVAVWDFDTEPMQAQPPGGHSGKISEVAISADGRLALSGSYDNTMILWDVDKRRQRKTFHSKNGTISHARLSADGGRAVGVAGTGVVWETRSGREVFELSDPWGDEAARYGIVDFEAITVAASGERKKSVMLNRQFGAIRLSADGRRAISILANALVLWDVDASKAISTTAFPENPVTLAWNSESEIVLVVHQQGFVDCLDLKQGRRLGGLHVSGDKLIAAELSPDSSEAVFCTSAGSLIRWKVPPNESTHVINTSLRELTCMSLDHRSHRALLGSTGGAVALLDFESGKILHTMVAKNEVSSVALAGNRFVVGDERGIVAFFELIA